MCLQFLVINTVSGYDCELCGNNFKNDEDYRSHKCDNHYELTKRGECTEYLLAGD